jgi:hypothetical protein
MRYRVYSGPRGSDPVRPLDKNRQLFKEFTSLDDAMSWARHVAGIGHVPLLIEGDDGTRLGREELATELGAIDGSSRSKAGRAA